jgi:cyanate permease
VTASLTPWIAQRFGWTTSFATAAALAMVGAICWIAVHPERPLVMDASDMAQRPAMIDREPDGYAPARAEVSAGFDSGLGLPGGAVTEK